MKTAIPFIGAILCITQLAAQNVGIGTHAPTAPLTVIANDTSKGIIQKTGIVEVGFYTTISSAYVQTWSPTNLNFATGNGAAKITILHSNGFVGVNASFPTAQLDVNGTFRLRDNGAGENKVLTSDANGNATWEGGIGFTAKLSTDINLATNVVTNLTSFIEEFDDGSNFNPANGRFTAPKAGVYQFFFTMSFDESSTDEKHIIANIQKNGATFKSFSFGVPGISVGVTGSYLCNALLKLDALETVSVSLRRTQTGGSTLRGGPIGNVTSFSGYNIY